MDILNLNKFNLKILLPLFAAQVILILVCYFVLHFSDRILLIAGILIAVCIAGLYIHLSRIKGTWEKHLE